MSRSDMALRASYVLFLLMLLFSVTACDKDEPSSPELPDNSVSRSVLVYIVAENRLVNFAPDDIGEMLAGRNGMTENDRLFIYLDGDSLPCIYEIDKHTKAETFQQLKPFYTYPEDCNSASAEQLKDFIARVQSHYPADEYGLVMWSHGSGWVPMTVSTRPYASYAQGPKRTFGVDNGTNGNSDFGDEMEIPDMAAVLRSVSPFRFILFDACFMQNVEVAYELKNVADYVIASPAEIPGVGAPYTALMPIFYADEFDPRAVVDAYVADFANSLTDGALISSVSCRMLDSLAKATWKYLHPLTEVEETDPYGLTSLRFDGVQNYFDYDRYYPNHLMPDFYDIFSVFKQALPNAEFDQWDSVYEQTVYRQSTSKWYSIYPVFNPLCTVDKSQYGGMTMFIPLDKYIANGHFFFADWLKTDWGRRMSQDTND